MGIAWYRDLAVCILALGAAVVTIVIGVLGLLFYLKLRPILNSLKAASKTVENISACVEEEVSRPLAQLASFVQGISQAVNLVSRFAKRKEGKNG